jgi:hypothetical protein
MNVITAGRDCPTNSNNHTSQLNYSIIYPIVSRCIMYEMAWLNVLNLKAMLYSRVTVGFTPCKVGKYFWIENIPYGNVKCKCYVNTKTIYCIFRHYKFISITKSIYSRSRLV